MLPFGMSWEIFMLARNINYGFGQVKVDKRSHHMISSIKGLITWFVLWSWLKNMSLSSTVMEELSGWSSTIQNFSIKILSLNLSNLINTMKITRRLFTLSTTISIIKSWSLTKTVSSDLSILRQKNIQMKMTMMIQRAERRTDNPRKLRQTAPVLVPTIEARSS